MQVDVFINSCVFFTSINYECPLILYALTLGLAHTLTTVLPNADGMRVKIPCCAAVCSSWYLNGLLRFILNMCYMYIRHMYNQVHLIVPGCAIMFCICVSAV